MAKRLTFSYLMPSGAAYKIEYRRTRDSRTGANYYRMKVLEHPPCNYRLGVFAYLDGDFLNADRNLQTIDRAKAVVCHWMTGFESYRQSGEFPKGKVLFDVKEAQHLLNDTAS